MTLQISHAGDTIIVTGSPNQALAAIRDLIKTKPDALPPIEVDFWKDGMIDHSKGFAAVESELDNIEAFILSYANKQFKSEFWGYNAGN
ncbi:hypothetical protein PHYNN_121 [Pantoea phage Phynn]|nr:hypothetical protein PHYNN_121 [Pantoea phage Phynn]